MKVRNAAIAMSAVAAAAVIAGCGETAGDEQTLTYTEGRGEFSPFGGASERRTPPGGGFTLSVPLEDDSGSAGELNAVCIATQESPGFPRTATCSGAADLPDGQLALNVTGKIREDVTGSIVGGTGDYEGATGTFESTGGEQPTDTFTFTLP
jgi:hypothetical protein